MSPRPPARPHNTPSTRRRLALLAVTGSLVATAACSTSNPGGGPAGPGPTAGTGSGVDAVRLYGSDGNMSNAFGDNFVGQTDLLAGMRGTTPLNPLNEETRAKLTALEPEIDGDFSNAAEAYDAVMIAALAAETARSTDAAEIARYINAVTVGPREAVCETVRACLRAVKAGRDIAYRGYSMRSSGFTEVGEPSSGSYGTMVFGDSAHIDDAKTEYVTTGDAHNEARQLAVPPPANRIRSAAPLRIGSLLPRTGDNGLAGPPEFAGVELAIDEVNDAGGVLGQRVVYFEGDDGTRAEVAAATVDRHIADGVQVIIGAGTSGVTKAVLPRVVAAQRVLISPAATSDSLSGLPDDGFFFRTAPPDTLQAKALTHVIMRYGAESVAVIARDDAYGTGLRDQVSEQLRSGGLKPDKVKVFTYKVQDGYRMEDFTDIAREVVAARPDSVLIVGFNESNWPIKALAAEGMRFGA